MTQKLQLDGHKLRYHPRLVADFMDGKEIVPLNVEVSLTAACNHRCLFCNFNYMGHQGTSIPVGRMPVLAREMADAGVKTMTFGGAGEPLLHPDLFPSLRMGQSRGMELAMTTNGILFKPGQMEEVADLLSWVRVSINGGTPEDYSAVHQCRKDEFDVVMKNVLALSEAKRKKKSAMTLGSQCVLVDENHRAIGILAKRLREAGVDYFAVKHFYPREEGEYAPSMSFRTGKYLEELTDLAEKLSTPSFTMVVRDVGKLERNRPYMHCPGLPFLIYIGEDGLLYTCFSHHDDKRTAIGNVVEHDFMTLWNSSGKRDAIAYLNKNYDKNQCQANCRHHQINLWLHALQNPPMHVNFI